MQNIEAWKKKINNGTIFQKVAMISPILNYTFNHLRPPVGLSASNPEVSLPVCQNSDAFRTVFIT